MKTKSPRKRGLFVYWGWTGWRMRCLGGQGMIDWRRYLTSDREICHGEICARGTRVFVTNILDSLAEGASREEILRSYPSLKTEHIDAAVAYAAELAHEARLFPLRPE